MKYDEILEAIFVDRPNRFVAHVDIDGRLTTVHVKNTGRCREFLLPGVKVILVRASNSNRKTEYDLVAVFKNNFGLINIDSQAPNQVVAEWLSKKDYDFIKPEYKFGESRIDFYMEKGNEKFLMEVKGCTLEKDGVGYFPDAPTERGIKHLAELEKAVAMGYHAYLAFVIQMDGIDEVRPNVDIHPKFGVAFDKAKAAGVEVLFLKCHVDEKGLDIIN